MRKYYPLTSIVLTGLLWLAGDAAWGQASPKLTLAQVLTTAHLSEGETVLAVSADSVDLPKDAVPPSPASSLDQRAAAFGSLTASFGRVTAVAPATMTLLNDQPGSPDLTQNINSFQALPELAASLDDAQWKMLTSPTGIGLADLTTDMQKMLFWAMFPDHTLKAAPATADGTRPDPDAATDYTAEIPSARLRLGQTARLMPPRANGGSPIYTSISPDPPGINHWVAVRDNHPPRTLFYGALVRAEVPNVLKVSDLDLDQLALQTQIPLTGLRTVGELVARIASTSKLELYTDRHFAEKPLAVLGNAPTANAPSLLRGLMLCVTGTFRRVGPAYVLTDSLIGNAVYRKIWSNYEAHAGSLADKTWEEARTTMFQKRSAYELPTFGDPIAATPEQEKPDPATSLGHFLPQVPESDKLIPFAKLTAAQQSAARRVFQQYQDTNADAIATDPTAAAVLNGKWGVDPQMRLEAVLPSAAQPIELSHYDLFTLVLPPESLIAPLEKQMDAWDKAHAGQEAKKPEIPIPALYEILHKTSRRAVLAAPRTSSELISLIGTMKRLGLNQLWLSVFTDGKAQLPNTPFSTDKTEDLLQTALEAAKGTGITIFPAADLLTWGQTAPTAVQDVDVLGENSVQSDANGRQNSPNEGAEDTPPPGMIVSPFVPEVQTNLTALMQKMIVYPKIGGLIWRDLDSTGYGCTLAERLAFLRTSHADPWDVSEGGYTPLDFHLPEWDDKKVDGDVQSTWQKFQSDAMMRLLQTLSAPVSASLPIFVESGRSAFGSSWYGTWNAQTRSLPVYHAGWEQNPPVPDIPAAQQTKAHSHTALAAVTVMPNDDPSALAIRMQGVMQDASWDGFVLDITEADGGTGIVGWRALAQEIEQAQSAPFKSAPPK